MLTELIKWFDGWIKGTKELIDHVEKLKELAEESKTLDEFKKKAEEYVKDCGLLDFELKAIVDDAINDVY